MTKTLSLLRACALAAFALSATAQSQSPSSVSPSPSRGPISVSNAWVRVTPGSSVAAVYLTLSNSGAKPVAVIGVESPSASDAMIHESKVEGGVSRMRPQGDVVVAPGQTLKFEPGGLHVMLQGLTHPLSPGNVVPLVLKLQGGLTLTVNATVRPLTAE